MDDGYSYLGIIIVAAAVILCAAYVIWRYYKSKEENVTEEDIMTMVNEGHVLIHGRKAPILGRVCMDQFMVDVTEIPEARVDDPVVLIGQDGGEEILVEDLAAACGGFHYEIVCDIGKRVPRVYKRFGEYVGSKDYFDDIYHGFGNR